MTAGPTSPALRPPPTANPHFVVRAFGDDSRQPVRFYLYKDVLEELVFASQYAEEGTTCVAVLTGGFGIEENRGFVEVTGFTGLATVPALEELYAAVRPSADEWVRSGPSDPMVGIFVGRAGFEPPLDPEVARVHFSLFNIPFQPVVICDTERGSLSVVARATRSAFFNAAFRAVGLRDDAAALKGEPKTDTTDADDAEGTADGEG